MFDFIRRIFNVSTYSSGSVDDIIRRVADLQRTSSGVNVNEETAMRFATVWACVRLLSDTMAQLPCHLKERDASGATKTITDDPLAIAIGISPDTGLTPFDFWKSQAATVLLRGYSLAKIIRGGDSIIRLVPVLNVEKIERKTTGEYLFTHRDADGQPQEIRQADAFFAFYALGSDLLPMSPIKMQSEAIGLGIRAQQHGSHTLSTNATPSGTLNVVGKLDKQAKNAIKEQWDLAYGPNGTGGVAVLEGDAKFSSISMTNEDAQLLQTRQFQRQEICGIYGVPPHMISDTAQAKGWSTMEQMMTEFVTLSLNPLTIRFEQAIARALISHRDRSKRFIKFATTGLLRGDIAARSNLYQSAINSRWMTPNEARGYEDMNPLPGGDEFPAAKGPVTNEQPKTTV